MATFGEFLKKERKKRTLNQSDFGQHFGIIMTDISKIENGHKKFPYASLEKLSEFLDKDFSEIKNLFVADKLVVRLINMNALTKYFRLQRLNQNT